ncbi:hypothetical protein AX15_004042 [Amanita polypyramis BW_CC]|nr:hypothetical protein AX15_004042 [Amanita polypyramis BW_CC]
MPPLPLLPPAPLDDIRYRLSIEDLGHEGVDIFLKAFGPNPRNLLQRCVTSVVHTLYNDIPTDSQPIVKSITLVLSLMLGVAHTTGTEQDKEIYFSLPYIQTLPPALAASEIEGVLVHEIVHCFQYNALDTCPGGLIEGIADFVRLRTGLAPPHWTTDKDGNWDAGYEKTGYFLNWIETRQANAGTLGFVKSLNLAMRHKRFDPSIFADLTQLPLDGLWDLYCNAN